MMKMLILKAAALARASAGLLKQHELGKPPRDPQAPPSAARTQSSFRCFFLNVGVSGRPSRCPLAALGNQERVPGYQSGEKGSGGREKPPDELVMSLRDKHSVLGDLMVELKCQRWLSRCPRDSQKPD